MDAISIENTLVWKHSVGTPTLDHLNEICQHLWREDQPRNKRNLKNDHHTPPDSQLRGCAVPHLLWMLPGVGLRVDPLSGVFTCCGWSCSSGQCIGLVVEMGELFRCGLSGRLRVSCLGADDPDPARWRGTPNSTILLCGD